MANEWMGPRGHRVLVLFSESTRAAYARRAHEQGQTYTFTGAAGEPVTWLKGEHAYLAPNAASVFLARCNIKHDIVSEEQLTEAVLQGCDAIVIANAAHLQAATIAQLQAWLSSHPGRRLLVTGRTNLPPSLLGLRSLAPQDVTGYTGWRWLEDSPFAGPAWEPMYVSGYRGHSVSTVDPAQGSRVLARLLAFSGDLSSASTVTAEDIGPGVVASPQVLYVANPVFELIGGMLQAHLNVEPVRHWANPTHWGDTLLFFLRRLLLDAGWGPLWQARLRSFGTYAGVLSFRHDVHGMRDYTMLDYQVQNLIAASYDIENPGFSTNITEPMALDWVARTTRNSFIEPALHNDSSIGDPPKAILGKGLFTHIINAQESLGFTVCTCGRHAGGHMHPETLDAMDYLYTHQASVLGMCTFCYYHMIEYGVRDPNVMVGGDTIGGKELTYVTDLRRTIATPGIWYPFHAVVTTDAEWRPMRGWDRTHEYDAAFELVETIYGGHHSRLKMDDQLENGVYSFQYHPELARDPSINDGRGTLDYLRYCINLAERLDFWIATQKELYQRMGDWQDLVIEVGGGGREITVRNPTQRRIQAMVLEQRLPFASVWDGDGELVHVVRDAFVTVPPLAAGAELRLRFSDERCDEPLVRQPSNKGITVLDARRLRDSGETVIRVSVCRTQPLCVEGVDPEGAYRVQVDDEPARYHAPRIVKTIQAQLSNSKTQADAEASHRRAKVPGTTTFLDLVVQGHPDHFIERTVRIRALPPEQAARARIAMLAATPAKTGRVTPFIESVPAD
ncbi:hypothetical protein [Ramlibacter rhizophilus]|uniref:Uncharacterized protein n=1 Tax=Ramlibacter rhizophilus TaxID=1781167 RepID=A0A4Z0BL21_9BURK|nr:hypothetical protein [Ramlibacter rhizophilus]TFY98608.1 hypothetical protein EZ242_13835 [Ramlibacter rhizophilus]